jgi:hypothetical protein
MIRLFFGCFLVVAIGSIGCTGIQAVGPFAKSGSSSGGNSNTKVDKDSLPPEPIVIPAPTPTPPKCLVKPEDVTADNVDIIKQQLSAEFDADRKSTPSVPVTVQVSQYKDGVNVKQ